MKYLCFFIFVVFVMSINLRSQTISTIAGNGMSFANGIPATAAKVSNPNHITFDKWGNLYFTEMADNLIRKIDTDGIISTVAGNGTSGFSGDGGPATAANLNQPVSLVTDSVGNLLFTDSGNNRIRKVNVITGNISTIAGGSVGFSGDGGNAISAQFKQLGSICFDYNGNLYVEDCGNLRVRKIDTGGIITTIAGNGIVGWSGDGGPATSARSIPWGTIIADTHGNIYYAEYSQGVIRKVNAAGIISTIAGDTTRPHLYNGDNIPATSARIDPFSIALDTRNGDVYISDYFNNRIRKVTTDGLIHTFCGTGAASSTGDSGSVSTATIHHPSGMIFDTCGNLYFGQIGTPRIRKITFNPDCIPMAVPNVTHGSSLHTTLYPNPATETVTIKAGVAIENISISNAMGQVVLQKQLNDDKKTATVPVHHLPAGIYVVQVNGLYAGKMVKAD